MSAQAHRHEAAKERKAAQENLARYDPDVMVHTPRGPQPGVNDVDAIAIETVDYNPTSWRLDEAAKHRAHAAEHERAAAELDRFEAEECKAFRPGVRSACPFMGPVRAAEEIEGGVRIRLAAGAPVATVAAHMRCHLAFARTRAFDVAECPLMIRGAEVRLSADRTAIEFTSRDRSTAQSLRRRAAALIDAAH